MILYNIPGRTGVNIQPETIASLCREVDNIVGVKEATGNFSGIAQLMNLTDGTATYIQEMTIRSCLFYL